jgi:hypothetical protein
MHLSPREAAAALAEVEQARAAMRRAVRAHRGHLHFWIWGLAWIVMPLIAYFGGNAASRYFPFVCLLGGIASTVAGFSQGRQIRAPIDRRFLSLLAALVGFAAIYPIVLHAHLDAKSAYAYIALVVMQGYVIAGIWSDTYLLWVGLLITALILVGVFVFPAIFWLWMAVFGGGTLLVTGFYVRNFWR